MADEGGADPDSGLLAFNGKVVHLGLRARYTLTATATPAGTGSVTGAGSYPDGTNATLTATPAAGYVFSAWSGDVTGAANPIQITMDGNKSVTATFAKGYTLTVTIAPTDGGTVTGAGPYAPGGVATLTATANPGYRFKSWSGAPRARPIQYRLP